MSTVPTNPTDRPSSTPTGPNCLGAPAHFEADCGQPGPHGPHPIGQLLPAPTVEVQRRLRCPDWCTTDHTGDDPADPIDNLILHMGDDHTDGTVRRLMHVHQGSKLDVRVARTDCPQEGTVGVPALLVRADLEVTTWEQAAELAHAILDGFGYLAGAEQD